MCFSLELAYKDAVKKNDVYDKVIVLLMGVYYFYRNSPKMRECLRKTCLFLGIGFLIPSRVGGTRWVGHLLKAINVFIKMYPAIITQMTDILQQKGAKVSFLFFQHILIYSFKYFTNRVHS